MEKIKEDLKHLYDEIDARLNYYLYASYELDEEQNKDLSHLLNCQKALKEIVKKIN